MKKPELILFAILMFALSLLFFGLLSACLVALAVIFSGLIFSRKEITKETEAGIMLLTVIITLWLWIMKDALLLIFFQEENLVGIFVMTAFALPLTIAFIVILIKSKNPKPQQIAPISKYETESVTYLKKLNFINTVIHLAMLGLSAYSFFIIPYDLLKSDVILLIIPQSLLTLIIAVSLFWGAAYPETERSQKNTVKIAKFALWLSMLLGKIYAANLQNTIEKDAGKIFVKRWSAQTYYVVLILLLPFYTFFLGLPAYYGVEPHSLWEAFVYCVTNIPLVQINIIIFLFIYIISYIPLTLAFFINEKTIISVERYKTVSLKRFFIRNIVISGFCVMVGLGLSFSILLGSGSDNNITAKIEEQISHIRNTNIVIFNETASSEFTSEDYTHINTIITGQLGAPCVYKTVEILDAQTDPSGEKFISATFAGYGEDNEQVTCFMFRKYLTESNYHQIGEIELYMCWVSESIIKQDIAEEN